MPPKRTTEVKYYTLTDSGYIEINATPQELETYLEESQEWQRVRHGHWEHGEDVFGMYCQCSECGNQYYGSYEFKYCPHCGAKMDEEEETWKI